MEINPEDKEILEEHYGSSRRGVEQLIDRQLRKKDWIIDIKKNKKCFLDIVNDIDKTQVKQNNNITFEDVLKNIIETRGEIKRRQSKGVAKMTGYSGSSERSAWSTVKEQYHTDKAEERAVEIHGNLLKKVREIKNESIYRTKEKAKEAEERILQEAKEELKKEKGHYQTADDTDWTSW